MFKFFLLKPAPFCKLFAGLDSIYRSTTSFPLSDFCFVLVILFCFPSYLLLQYVWQIWQELSFLSSCSIILQWVPRHSFLPGNDTADELARREELLVPSAISCSLSLAFHILSCLFSDWRHTVSSKFFDIQVPSISIKELVLSHHACCILSHLCCNGHNLLLSSYL